MGTEITDGIRFNRTWVLEHYGRNPVVEKFIMDNFTPAEELKLRAFIYFLSDAYPETRPALFGPPKSVEEYKEE